MSGKSVMEYEFQDVLPNSPLGVCCCGCCCIINFVLIILFFPCTVTQLGQFKYGIIKNKVTGYVAMDESYEPGRYWIGFWKEFVEFPSTLCTIEFSEERPEKNVQHLSVLRSRDKDGKQIALDVSIQYRLHLKDLGPIYKDMLINYEDIYISELRDALAKAANLFGIQEAWENYKHVVDLMKERCDEVLKNRHAECWGLQLWGVGLTSRYETKLIMTQVRKQAQKTEKERKTQSKVRAVTQVLLAEYRKNITIIESGGWGKSYEIEEGAKAEAMGNTIYGSGVAVEIVKTNVCPEHVKDANNTCMSNHSMSGPGLVSYQKYVMLENVDNASLVYEMGGSTLMKKPIEVAASRDIISGKSRRLLLSQNRVPEL